MENIAEVRGMNAKVLTSQDFRTFGHFFYLLPSWLCPLAVTPFLLVTRRKISFLQARVLKIVLMVSLKHVFFKSIREERLEPTGACERVANTMCHPPQ